MATPDPAALTTGFKTVLAGGAVGTGPGNVQALHAHWTNDTKAEVETAGYFNNVYAAYEGAIKEGDGLLVFGDIDGTPFMAQYIFSVVVSGSDVELTEGTLGGDATIAEINNVADVSGRVQELTATGAVTAGKQSVELNHASVVVAATIADASNHQGLFIVKNTSASGTAAHTLTLTSGTFDGTNNVATLNAPNEALVVYFDSAGNGTIIENVGSVGLS